MSILIKDMKMPNACYECEFYNEVCPFDVGVWYDPLRERADGCPLLEVPNHGDLIDRDVLLSKVQKWYWEALETVKRMPTVIPAERSEE